MGKFIDQTNAYQEYISQMHAREDCSDNDSLTYTVMSATKGLVKPVSFRIPVTLAAQLDELIKYVPYSTKGEMITVMLSDQLEQFINTCGEPVKESFAKVAMDAFKAASGQVDEDVPFDTYVDNQDKAEIQEEMKV